ncbi:MAG: DUF1015 family protein [Lachnospiraceae bacterium]|nr:DUF1015 family protein [Lachnospiraceae bacterium]
MAKIRPFSAIRPTREFASEIAALPYDVFNEAEAREEVLKHPLSFLRIDRPETQFPEGTDPYSEEVYRKAHKIYVDMKLKKQYFQDLDVAYYIYRLTMGDHIQNGIVAMAAVSDYENGIIKKHENTRVEKELDRINHITELSAQTGPIFLAYRANEVINNIVKRVIDEEKPIYDFTSDDGIRHTMYKINESRDIADIIDQFKHMNSIYIADGHHRAASAVKVCKKKLEYVDLIDDTIEANYFLSVLFPHDELLIMDYNRTVKDLNGLSEEEFLNKIKDNFTVEKMEGEYKKPSKKGEVNMYLNGQWYILNVNPELIPDDPVKSLDVSLLQDYLLDPVLGILDPRTDDRIDFVGGIRGYKELEKRADTDMKVSFAMYPTTIEELFNVADAGLLMPPKSTWFEPKLRSGLIIHEI